MQIAQPTPATYRYPVIMGWSPRLWLERSASGALLIALFLLVLALLTLVVPGSEIESHNVLHHLNFLPLMVAGMLFGWRGAAIASVFAAVVNAPIIHHHWQKFPLDAKDQIVELCIFSAAGLIAGYLSDRERAQRTSLERTKRELEKVYTELQENIASMKKAERLSAAGRLSASLAHEIRNPLASISGAAGILKRGTGSAEYVRDCLEIIDKESQRLNKLLTGFLNFARPRSPRLQRTDPDAILGSVSALALHAAQAGNISIVHQRAADSPEIECDPEQLKQVLLNLLINAIDASPAGSTIRLRTVVEEHLLALEVEDSGSGIPEELTDQIFDPFFTTKPSGTGLGLAISSMIVAQHDGALIFHRNAGGGSTFRIELPLHKERALGQ
ncbi:MAG TPA: ATP-binding protein [Alloacidobacterium sp.]|nr:ATP-binding protein [Alloacidobacterium sp.]